MIELIILDAGGVLYVWNQSLVDGAVVRFLTKHGVADYRKSTRIWREIEKIVCIGKITRGEAYEKWLEAMGIEKNAIDDWIQIQEHEIWSKLKKTSAVNRTLWRLRKKYLLAVLSDTIDSKSEMIKKMQLLGIDYERFNEIFTSHDLGICKPDERAFRAVMDKFHVRPSEALFVTDMSDELVGARKAGLVTLGLNCRGGDYCIRMLGEIQNVIDKLG